LAEPQALPAGNAKEWIGAAWRLFKLRPGKLIGAALLFGAINIGLGMIPYIGGLLQAAISIFEIAGFAFIAKQLEEEGDFEFGQIFIGFQENTKSLAIIGAIGAVVALISNLAAIILIVGQVGDVSSAANLDLDEAQMMSAGLSVMALSLILGIVYSAFTFLAPALIILENEPSKRAILLSWQGFSRNIGGAVFVMPILISFLNYDIKKAVSTGLFFVIFSSSAGFLSLAAHGLVHYDIGVLLGLGSLAGVYAGVKTSHKIGKKAQKRWMIALIVTILCITVRKFLALS